MTYDEMIIELKELNETQGVVPSVAPHCSNLIHQLNKKESNKEVLFNEIFSRYLQTRAVSFTPDDVHGYIDRLVEVINEYMDFYWPPVHNPFSHQADFTSSIIPEMLCTIFRNIVRMTDCSLEVSAQKELAIECVFDITGGGTIRLKNKRVDVSVFKQCPMVFNGKEIELPVPLLAIECKTNLDKNMLSGIEQSVGDLKKTFPDCYYFVITELSDFDVKKSNYASSGINEMYILRQQKRAVIRSNPMQRRPLNASLIYEIVDGLNANIKLLNSNAKELSSRMENGKLIGRIV